MVLPAITAGWHLLNLRSQKICSLHSLGGTQLHRRDSAKVVHCTVICCNTQWCYKPCAFTAYRGKPGGCQDIFLDYSSFSFSHAKLSDINFSFSPSIPKQSRVNFKREWDWHNIKGHSRSLHFYIKSYTKGGHAVSLKRDQFFFFFSCLDFNGDFQWGSMKTYPQ